MIHRPSPYGGAALPLSYRTVDLLVPPVRVERTCLAAPASAGVEPAQMESHSTALPLSYGHNPSAKSGLGGRSRHCHPVLSKHARWPLRHTEMNWLPVVGSNHGPPG